MGIDVLQLLGTTDQITVSAPAPAITLSLPAAIKQVAGGSYGWAGRGSIDAPADGVFRLTNDAGTSFGRLQFGGTSSAFPALQRNGAALEAKVADSSAYASVVALAFYLGANGSIGSGADGLFTLLNAAGTDFGRLRFGGTTAAFSAIKRSGATLAFRVADDSADCAISASALTLSGLTAGRIPIVSTAGLLADDSTLLWDNTLKRLTVGAVPFRTPDESIFCISKTYATQTLLTMTEQVRSSIKTTGGGGVQTGRLAFSAWLEDGAGVVNKAITNAVNNGGGLIRITAAGHTLSTGNTVAIFGVVGTVEANVSGLLPGWTITVIDANTFDLQGSTFTNAYISGGTVSNASQMIGYRAVVMPTTSRAGLASADCNGYTVSNAGTAQATDAFWVTDELSGGLAWRTLFSSDSRTEYILRYTGTCDLIGIDLSTATFAGSAIKLGQGHQLILGTTAPTTLATKTVSTDATGTVGAAAFGGTYTKNDTNLRVFSSVLVQPTLNTGGSNTNTYVSGLLVTSTNTATTGIAELNLVRTQAIAGPTAVFNFSAERVSADTTGASIVQQKARGTPGSESVIQSGDAIGAMAFRGYDAASSGQPFPATSTAQFRVLATENHDTTHHGGKVELRTTAIGSTTLTTRLTIDENGLTLADALNIVTGTSTGMKIGTTTTQKLGLWNVTPVIQPSTTGETVGFTAGAGAAVKDDSTFTGNVGATAYRISDVVKALKNVGLLAA